MADDSARERMLVRFCGFTENMWREGNEEMLGICLETVIPVLRRHGSSRIVFESGITDEFRDWLSAYMLQPKDN